MTMQQRGFTIVELLIVLIILTILMALAVVNLRGTIPKARDAERTADVISIATHLESFARTRTPSSIYSGEGTYIATAPLRPPLSMTSEQFAKIYLPNIDQNVLRAPDVESSDPMSLVAATNSQVGPLAVSPAPTISTYVYQPLKDDGSLCGSTSDDCSVFYIYYMRETPDDDCVGDPQVYCTIEGKRL